MMDDTVLIIAPEHGRNFYTNTSVDLYGRRALDHTAPTDPNFNGDSKLQMAREIFCLVVGPPSVVSQGVEITATSGESIEVVPIISNILGFDNAITNGLLRPYNLCGLKDAFI